MIRQCLVCCSVLSSRHGYNATLYPGYYSLCLISASFFLARDSVLIVTEHTSPHIVKSDEWFNYAQLFVLVICGKGPL